MVLPDGEGEVVDVVLVRARVITLGVWLIL